ncbi:CCR4-NOT transcription complex subunit 1-like, partial [Limulus polyphemus]|uniref:CCR4-NOT transcription complex subunit 1-like n=1 Tax=Limulus polyphemus TaxID=6850 RepID=A0ABM1B8U5_LIMPO
MNLDSLSFALSQVSYLAANLTKKHFKSSVQEITTSLNPHPHLLPNLSKVLKLTQVQEVAFGLALLHSSHGDICNYAIQFVKEKIPELLQAYTNSGGLEQSLQDFSTEFVHLLLIFILHTSKDKAGLSSEDKEAFLQTLRRDFPQEKVPVILAPLLYPTKQDIFMEKAVSVSRTMAKEIDDSVVDLVREIGYFFTASLDACKSNLINLCQNQITPSIVARILGLMARTHTGLGDGILLQEYGVEARGMRDVSKKSEGHSNWNVDVFVQALNELVPSLNWKDVVWELDHSGFIVKDREGIKLLWHSLMIGLDHNIFPSEYIFRHWRNSEGQLSLFQQILKNSDVLCLLDYSCNTIETDILKPPPEKNRDISNWMSVDLVETLLHLSDVGYYRSVQELFKFPIQNCPDVLALGLLQISSPLHLLQQEILSNLIPIFLENHPNSAIVLQYAWYSEVHSATVRPIVMHAMIEWCVRGDYDHSHLSRILDVTQDLKALSDLMNSTSFPFVIDLACMAYRREYVKLDTWLSEKIEEHGERFIQACVSFLKRHCPKMMGELVKEDKTSNLAHPSPEIIITMLTCLQNFPGISKELMEAVLAITKKYYALLSKLSHPPTGVLNTPHDPQPVFLAATMGESANPFDSLGGLNTSMGNLYVGDVTNFASSSAPDYPFSAGLSSFPQPTPGSPVKLLQVANPVVQTGPSLSQNPFSSIIPSFQSQLPGLPGQLPGLPGQFGSSIGMVISPAISLAPPVTGYVPPTVDHLRQDDISTILSEVNMHMSKEVEDEANGYFKRIYRHSSHPPILIDEVLQMLRKFQESPIKRERDMFNCMLRKLFEVYHFLHQHSDQELLITAEIFGGIVEQGLVTYVFLGLILRCIFDALKNPYGNKMYYFGIIALDRCKRRLKEFPQYCCHLSSISHFLDFPAHLIEFIQYGACSQDPPNHPQGVPLPQSMVIMSSGIGPIVPVSVHTSSTIYTSSTAITTLAKKTSTIGTARPSIANTTNIDTLLVATEKGEKMMFPPESVQDKVEFIINNLSQINLVQKTEEYKKLVKEEYRPWAAQYMVMKRVSIEHNFHTLYSNFLDKVRLPDLRKLIVHETLRNIKVLLRSDKGIENFSDRSLLKNLGHWLGMLTLAKNKPILQIDIDIKALLIEAYHKGQKELLYVVPFVAKILESCAKSRIFKPPNPWTIGIMSALAELHQEPELKLTLKFEIEVLCKNLSLDINWLSQPFSSIMTSSRSFDTNLHAGK